MHTPTQTERDQFKNVWVIAEQRGGEIQAVTYELLGAARVLAARRQAEVWCVVLAADTSGMIDEITARGADIVLTVEHEDLVHLRDAVDADVLVRLIEKYRPETVLCGATSAGRSEIPRVAVRVNAGLTADCTELNIDPETGNLLQTRPAFGGNIMATIVSGNHRPQMATVRPRVMQEPEPDHSRPANVIKEPFLSADALEGLRVLKAWKANGETVSIADAQFIITGGRGVQGSKGFNMLKQFAHLVGGAVGASRAAVDAGWIDYAHQVGQTGQTVQPRVYMACGVSGQIQHLVGMQSADIIVAINKDPAAPIMQIADYAIVGDLFDIIPALMNELRAG